MVLVKSSVWNRKDTVIDVSNDLNKQWMGKAEKDMIKMQYCIKVKQCPTVFKFVSVSKKK